MTIIILLILTGFLFLILEFFVFPGITFAGIGGFILTGAGVYLGYQHFGASIGNAILAATVFAFIIVMVLAFRSNTWNKFMLKTSMTANVETVSETAIQVGNQGVATSRLNSVGKARFSGQEIEAHCPGQFIDPGTTVEVVTVFKTYVVVKPIN
jgi:membrane-bound ClpP family serine protease